MKEEMLKGSLIDSDFLLVFINFLGLLSDEVMQYSLG
jgi:hypothetical protein